MYAKNRKSEKILSEIEHSDKNGKDNKVTKVVWKDGLFKCDVQDY